MTDQKKEIPAGMIPVERVAKQKGIDAKKVIEMVRDGSYVGQIIDGACYVRSSMSKYKLFAPFAPVAK